MQTSDNPPRTPSGQAAPAGNPVQDQVQAPGQDQVQDPVQDPVRNAGQETGRDTVRDLERFGRISVELLHDIGGALALLSARIDVAQNEVKMGRSAGAELDAVREDADELRLMLIEILDELRGTKAARGDGLDIRTELERTIDRWYLRGTGTPLRLRSTLPPDARIDGPRTIFSRAVANLLRNAARHARSRVIVSLDPSADGRSAVLTVEDDGPGIPEHLRQRLFKPFESGTPGGHGLGLSFSLWAAERFGGTLRFEGPSAELGGACFCFSIPLLERRRPVQVRRSWQGHGPPVADAPGPRPPRPAAPSREPPRTLRVTVVDDDRTVGDVFARRLTRSGFEATAIAVLPGDTIEALAEALLRDGDPHGAVLIDLNLGIGSGLDLATALEAGARASGQPGSHVVMMTGGERISASSGFRAVHKLDAWEEICAVLDALSSGNG